MRVVLAARSCRRRREWAIGTRSVGHDLRKRQWEPLFASPGAHAARLVDLPAYFAAEDKALQKCAAVRVEGIGAGAAAEGVVLLRNDGDAVEPHERVAGAEGDGVVNFEGAEKAEFAKKCCLALDRRDRIHRAVDEGKAAVCFVAVETQLAVGFDAEPAETAPPIG